MSIDRHGMLLAATELTTSFVAIYTCPSGKQAEISAWITNRSGASRHYTLRLVPSGETPGDEHTCGHEVPQETGRPDVYETINMTDGDILYAKASSTNTNIVVTGVESQL